MSEIYKKLSSIDVSAHTKKNNGLKYLSWTWAWAELMKVYPDAKWEVVKNPHGLPFFESEIGFMVFTTITIDNITREMFLPVMNSSNKAMKKQGYEYTVKAGKRKVEACSMFDVNSTLMRCLVKNIALFGLGINIYAGEDLPVTNPNDDPISKDKAKSLSELCKIDAMRDYFLKAWQIGSFEELILGNYNGAEKWITDNITKKYEVLIKEINAHQFKAPTHRENSLKKHLGTAILADAKLDKLIEYVKHLKEESVEDGKTN